MKKQVRSFLLLLCLVWVPSAGQVAGDYGSLGTGNWGTTGANWLVFVSASDWSDATAAPGAPTASINVWIRAGHTVNMEASSKACKNLNIAATGAITTSATGSSITVNGDAVVNGALGTSTTAPVVQFGTSGTISGSGNFYFSKLRPNANSIKITVDMNINGYTATGNFINCNSKTPFTLEVKAGRTVTLPTGGYISTQSNSSTSDPGAGANVTWDIYGTVIAPITSGGGISLANLPTFTSTLNIYNGATVTVGRVSAVSAGTGDVSGIVTNVYSGGTLNIQGGSGATTDDYGKGTMNVQGTLTLGPSLTSTFTIGNLTINNGADVTLSGPTTVTGTLTLTSGTITTTTTNLLTLGASATVSGGSASSFVKGPMSNTWGASTATKTYPLGKGSVYRPLEIALTTPASPVIRAEVFNGTAGGSSTLDKISAVRYYQTSLISGTAASGGTAKITYGADDAVQNSGTLVVAQSSTANGAYASLGNSASDASSVTSSSSYNPASGDYLILGSTGSNALPVELSTFIAEPVRGGVTLRWSTATEVNNQGFAVQKRVNGEWNTIGSVQGAGTSNVRHDYSYTDHAAKGAVSYRLKQTDRDGAVTYSAVVEAQAALTVAEYGLSQNYPNPFNPATTMSFALRQTERATVKVYDIIGKEVATLFDGVAQADVVYTLRFDASKLSSGVYFYSLTSNGLRNVKTMILNK